MIIIYSKNKNYIAQQILKTLKKHYISNKKKKEIKYKYFNIKLTYIYSNILFMLISFFMFFWIIKQFYLIKFIY
ncbi:orf D (apicoplast) [Besnoitia besnoiti]|uniref:Orf D n=1 Tax=Besnoitia besnoiti TaxID=94643 RepID=A0A2A9M4L3_BESBE|nr:orf D [Besnoitia besnoiti]PFH30583.1 orf D [Besnoitia besnoiti]